GALYVDGFVDGFDDDASVFQVVQAGLGGDPLGCLSSLVMGDRLFACQTLEAAVHGSAGTGQRGVFEVEQHDVVPCQCARLGDAGAHGASSDDGYFHATVPSAGPRPDACLLGAVNSTSASRAVLTMSTTASFNETLSRKLSSPMLLLATSTQPVVTWRSAPMVNSADASISTASTPREASRGTTSGVVA